MTHRTDRVIENLIGHLTALSNELPHARRALLDQLVNIDGHPAGGERVGSRGTAELTPVESAVSQRQHVEVRLHDFDDNLNAMVLIVRNLRADCQRLMHTPTVKPRCDGGTGRDGYLEWGRPDCNDVPGRGKVCIACYHRERRWRIEHGMPTREDAA